MNELESETSSSDRDEEVKGFDKIEKSFKTIFNQLSHGNIGSTIDKLLDGEVKHGH